MEKCNYCLQRISRARRTAEKEERQIVEGEMVTACQAACPTRAIHFGDLNSDASDVSRLRKEARHYTLLEELNTRPRTTYLKRLYVGDEAT
jgi:molybdopterin-containing oxidoreductase family iron-sulfur binding subunit